MIVDNVLKVIREYEVEHMRTIHAPALKLCKELGCILDCATSDVVLYVYAPNQECADKITILYGVDKAYYQENSIYPPLKWYCIG